MGFFAKYMISILIIFFATQLIWTSITTESTASDVMNLSLNSSYQQDIQNAQEELMNVSLVDAQVDPSSSTDVAGWFGKSLAIAGKTANLLATVVSGSISFVADLLSNISSLPAPWNILGQIIGLGLSVLAIILALKLIAVIIKVDL